MDMSDFSPLKAEDSGSNEVEQSRRGGLRNRTKAGATKSCHLKSFSIKPVAPLQEPRSISSSLMNVLSQKPDH